MIPFIVATYSATAFPSEPITSEVELGRKIGMRHDMDDWEYKIGRIPATAELAKIEEVYRDDRIVLGTWNEGIRDLDVEWAIRLSPPLMSRWCGFLEARELWPTNEINTRWNSITSGLGRKPVYVIVLSAFPKKTTFGLGDDQKPTLDEIEDVKIVFETNGRMVESSSFEIYRQRAKTRSELDQVPWWTFTRLSNDLTQKFEKPFEPPIIQRGNYYRIWRWVTPNDDLGTGPVTIKIASRRKICSATFGPPFLSNPGT